MEVRGACFSTAVCPACPLHGCRSHGASMAQARERGVLPSNKKWRFLLTTDYTDGTVLPQKIETLNLEAGSGDRRSASLALVAAMRLAGRLAPLAGSGHANRTAMNTDQDTPSAAEAVPSPLGGERGSSRSLTKARTRKRLVLTACGLSSTLAAINAPCLLKA